ncbi:hypothetical protein H5968_14210 [Sphaerospermopsis sp. LEGE 00249]|uniref:hypothetical protein n=1 Tax=Sphaerospermopsis sp. LEGE 00249 TaxID=1380707 RepID=UPI00164E573F|nr:hypothetical protein [Sphaerospermopsis sp. LEGE 00249]MBC5796270.1 hypothetical protein [Sphaerospermopsis sp. LEGE 00249]
MYLNLIKVVAATILLNGITACTTPTQNQISADNSRITENKPIVDSNKSAQNRPNNKTATISVEGEKTNISLKLYQEKNIFSTYFPQEDFLVQNKDINKVREVKFTANFGGVKNENAYVKFVFPDDLKALEEVKNFINSKDGIIASNKWQIVNRSSTVTYPWAKAKITFSQGQEIFGNIYIGEEKGKVFYAITHYPAEYGDGFEPRADLILSNLEIGG